MWCGVIDCLCGWACGHGIGGRGSGREGGGGVDVGGEKGKGRERGTGWLVLGGRGVGL